MKSIKSYSNKDVELKNKTTEGLNLVIDKEILDDQRTLEVGTKLPEKAKVDSEDKTDFETFKVVYKGAIDDKCLEEFGTMEDTKLWEDTAKEMFLKSSEYIPEEDKKADGELEKKTEGRTLKEDQSKAKELEFSSLEFEKQIPNVMRWKEWSVVNDLDLYWITQQFFNEEDVKAFAEAFKTTGFDKAFVTVRDLSTYEYDRDLASKVFVVVNKDGTYDMTDYLNTCESEGYDKSLYESKSIKKEVEENPYAVKYKAMLNGKEVKSGDKIKDFRGKEHIFRGITNPGTPFGGRNGKVQVASENGNVMEYYPSVFNIELVKVDENKKVTEVKGNKTEETYDEIEDKIKNSNYDLMVKGIMYEVLTTAIGMGNEDITFDDCERVATKINEKAGDEIFTLLDNKIVELLDGNKTESKECSKQ